MSEHLVDTRVLSRLLDNNQPAMSYINNDDMPDSLFAGNLAQRALHIFQHYGDVYQTAGAYRTLAKCYWALNDYRSSLICLHNALEEDTVIERAPDLVASIREQLSLAYSAIDDKPNSDYNRNIYLDMQEKTRQDRQLEARAEQLDKSAKLLNSMIAAILVVLVVLATLLIVLYLKRKRTQRPTNESADGEERRDMRNDRDRKAALDAEPTPQPRAEGQVIFGNQHNTLYRPHAS